MNIEWMIEAFLQIGMMLGFMAFVLLCIAIWVFITASPFIVIRNIFRDMYGKKK